MVVAWWCKFAFLKDCRDVSYFPIFGQHPLLQRLIEDDCQGFAITSAVSFNALGWRQSGPGDFDGLSFIIFFSTSSFVMSMSSSASPIPFQTGLGMLDVSSRVKTLAKNLFKTSALSSSRLANEPSSRSRSLIPVFTFVLDLTYFQNILDSS